MIGKALIVDDERLFREGLRTMIADLDVGWTVCGLASNGQEALDIFNAEKPELIISDIRMPQMDGLMLANTLRSLGERTLIVFLTGYKDFEYAQLAIQNQVFDYMLKPCSKEQLTALFDKINRFQQRLTEGQSSHSFAQDLEEFKVEDHYIRKAMNYVERHYAEQCTLSAAAEELYLSAGYLGKRFKLETGIPFSQYVIQYRMDKAMQLLKHTSAKIYEVAAAVGLDDSNYFATTFKRHFGIAPSDVRKHN